jgi:hypothetical protein
VDYGSPRNRRRMAVIVYSSFAAEMYYRHKTDQCADLSVRELASFLEMPGALNPLDTRTT